MSTEKLAGIGYLSPGLEHVLLSFRNPAVCNAIPALPAFGHKDVVQIALTIDTAIDLRAALNAFLHEGLIWRS